MKRTLRVIWPKNVNKPADLTTDSTISSVTHTNHDNWLYPKKWMQFWQTYVCNTTDPTCVSNWLYVRTRENGHTHSWLTCAVVLLATKSTSHNINTKVEVDIEVNRSKAAFTQRSCGDGVRLATITKNAAWNGNSYILQSCSHRRRHGTARDGTARRAAWKWLQHPIQSGNWLAAFKIRTNPLGENCSRRWFDA